MTIHYQGHGVTLHHGDCLDVLRALPDNSVDSVVTDPPYGLEFMGKDWDRFAPRDRKNATVWDGRRTDEGDWKEAAAERSGKGGGGPSYRSQHKGAKRCTLCGRRAFSGSPCECPEPVWVVEHRQEAPSSMLAFQSWCTEWTRECYRVLKPGGHLLAFGGTRTWHRLACAVEDAGFEVRDSIAWLYGSGFPKSLDVSKAIDKHIAREEAPISQNVIDAGLVGAWLRDQCAARGVGSRQINDHFDAANVAMRWMLSAPTETKRPQVPKWDQWEELRHWLDLPDDMDAEVWRLNGNKGTPAPLAFTREAKVYDQSHGFARVGLAHGAQKSHTATSQVVEMGYATGPGDTPATPDAERWSGFGTALKPAFEPVVVARKPLAGTVASNVLQHGTGALNIDACRVGDGEDRSSGGAQGSAPQPMSWGEATGRERPTGGRWPANVVLDESQAAALDEQSGESRDGTAVKRNRSEDGRAPYEASSYMITDRSREDQTYGGQGGASRFFPTFRYEAKAPANERPRVNGTAHPTVKPLDLMRWLVRLVTPPGGTVLEPFAGSGTTVEACIIEGFDCIAIEKGDEYLPLIMQRIHRRRDPVAAIRQTGDELGLFELDGEGA